MAENCSYRGEPETGGEQIGIQVPLVSVVIPAYQCAHTIDRAIASALGQEVEVEILVVDDCSTDHLDQVMCAYSKDRRVRYLKNASNLGVARTRNRGVKEARAPYTAFLDADDCWREGKLTRQLAAMAEAKAVLCSTAREMMEADGTCTGHVIPVRERITYRDMLCHNSIVCSSVLLPTNVAREFPMLYDDSHEDYITWMRILGKYEYAIGINEPLVLYCRNSAGKSANKLHSAKMMWKAYRYLEFPLGKRICCFVQYAVHGVMKHHGKK